MALSGSLSSFFPLYISVSSQSIISLISHSYRGKQAVVFCCLPCMPSTGGTTVQVLNHQFKESIHHTAWQPKHSTEDPVTTSVFHMRKLTWGCSPRSYSSSAGFLHFIMQPLGRQVCWGHSVLPPALTDNEHPLNITLSRKLILKH